MKSRHRTTDLWRCICAATFLASVVATIGMAPSLGAATAKRVPLSQIDSAIESKIGKIRIATGDTTRGITGKTITIAGLATITAQGQAIFPGMCDGARARFAQANREGGVDGYKINYVGCSDDGSDPSTNQLLTERAVAAQNVFALVPFAPLVANSATGSYLNAQHVPYFGFALSPDLYCGWSSLQFSFGVDGSESCLNAVPGFAIDGDNPIIEIKNAAKQARISGPLKLALVAQQDPINEQDLTIFKKIAEIDGVQVVYAKAPLPGAASPPLTDYEPVVHSVLSTGANWIYLIAGGAPVIGYAAALKQANYTGGLLQPTFTDTTYLQTAAVAQALNGTFGGLDTIGTPAQPTPEQAVVAADLRAIGSTASPAAIGTLISYASADLFLSALKQVKGALTAEKLAAVLNRGYTYPGIPGVVCPSTWPAAHVSGATCSAMVKLNGVNKSISLVQSLGTHGATYVFVPLK
jgi:branched-chain amino acid transport system substrate-binding protein